MGLFGGARAAQRKRVQRELAQSPSWQVQVHGQWLCPFCSVLAVRVPDDPADLLDGVLDHLDGACPAFLQGEGSERSLAELNRFAAHRRLRRQVKAQLVRSPSWQLMDVARRWFCPYCGETSGVTIPGDRKMTEEVLRGILEHVEGCYAYDRGRGQEKPFSHLKAVVRYANQSRKLTENVRRKLEGDPAWRRKDARSRWICPYCLRAQEHIDLSSRLLMFENAPGLIAKHLTAACTPFQEGAEPKPMEAPRASGDSAAADRDDRDDDDGFLGAIPPTDPRGRRRRRGGDELDPEGHDRLRPAHEPLLLDELSETGVSPGGAFRDPGGPSSLSARGLREERPDPGSGLGRRPEGSAVGGSRPSGMGPSGVRGGGLGAGGRSRGSGLEPQPDLDPDEGTGRIGGPWGRDAARVVKGRGTTLRQMESSGEFLLIDEPEVRNITRARESTSERARAITSWREEIERELAQVRSLSPELERAASLAAPPSPSATAAASERSGLDRLLTEHGLELGSITLPADPARGDFAEAFDLGRGRLGIAAGGVTGADAESPLVAAMARNAIRNHAAPDRCPGDVLRQVNREMFADLDGRSFVAVSYVLVDLASCRARLARAGLAAPLLVAPPGPAPAGSGGLARPGARSRPTPLDVEGMVMGIDRGPIFDAALEVRAFELAPGAMLVVFGNGVLEVRGAGREEFGLERMQQLVERYGNHEVEYLTDKFREQLGEFLEGAPRTSSDACLLALRRLGPH